MKQKRKSAFRPRKNSEYRHLHDTGFYRSWVAMKTRCLNVHDASYHRYGGRGILVCDRWMNFENFYADMYKSWERHKIQYSSTSLERIDVHGNYEPENCKWATQQEQNNNRTRHRMLQHKGVRMNLNQWARKLGIKRSTLAQRIYVYKWDTERALTS